MATFPTIKNRSVEYPNRYNMKVNGQQISCELTPDPGEGEAGTILNKELFDQIKKYIEEHCPIPVGGIYTTTVGDSAQSPGKIWPGTSWERYSEGRFLLGFGAGQGTNLGGTGGLEKVKLLVQHLASHRHNGFIPYDTWNYTNNDNGNHFMPPSFKQVYKNTSGHYAPVITSVEVGGDEPHENMPPYTVVVFWKRLS